MIKSPVSPNNKNKHKSCPFCNFSLLTGTVLLKGKNWFVLKSYKPIIAPHYLLIPTRHMRTMAELRDSEMKEYVGIFKKIYKIMKKDPVMYINGRKGQSVKHLHIHMFPNVFKPFEIENMFRSRIK